MEISKNQTQDHLDKSAFMSCPAINIQQELKIQGNRFNYISQPSTLYSLGHSNCRTKTTNKIILSKVTTLLDHTNLLL